MSETHTQSDQQYKAGVRREWAMAAPGWERWFETTESEHAGRVITQALLDAAKLKAGDAVLDVGAGYGEPGLSAAAAVGPTGHVTCLDISGDMLAFAERRARQAGLRNVDFVEADIETHSTRAERVRCGSRAAPRSCTRATRWPRSAASTPLCAPAGASRSPSGPRPDRVAFAVPVGVMIEMGVIDPPTPGPGPFALGEDGLLAELVRSAGFEDVSSGSASRNLRDAVTGGVHSVAARRSAAHHGAHRPPPERRSGERCGRASPTRGRPSKMTPAQCGFRARPSGSAHGYRPEHPLGATPGG